MSGPQVYLRWPSFTLSALRPEPLPHTLLPPVRERSFRAPFGIDKDLFNAALKPQVPIAFASAYIVTVFLLNAYNRKRNHKPWAVARQWWFRYFVVLHNAILTVYSVATFLAMCRAFAHTWPGFNNEHGMAGMADALCKIHGPRGLGDATSFNTTLNIWEAKNTAIRLGYDGNPDPTDFGRLWNEGLAFWGWFFYISKFYEVVDTLIILAKGKRSATLQTYHHAGAMLCMWAGIRYMSPPIWMFVFVNSFIHGLMYTYFTLSALGYRVPQAIKRSLTSLQIAQFLWGASYAAAHLFVQYDIPIATPYQVVHTISSVVSSATSKAQSATSVISEAVATPSAIAWAALGKKMLLRALGEEGLAENVHDKRNQPLNPVMEQKIEEFKDHIPGVPKYETRWRTDWTRVNCIDTSGEAFAIILNLFYLAPLTFLFARFFYKAYLRRGKPRTASQGAKQVVESAKEGEKKTEEKVEEAGKRLEAKIAKLDRKDVQEQLRRDVQAFRSGSYKAGRKLSSQIQDLEEQIDNAASKAKQSGKKAVGNTQQAGKDLAEEAKQTGKKAAGNAQQAGKNIVEEAKQQGKKLQPANTNGTSSPSKKSGASTPRDDKWFKSENDLENESVDQEDTAANSPRVNEKQDDFSPGKVHEEGIDYIKQRVRDGTSQAPADGGVNQDLLPADGTSNAESESKQDAVLEASRDSRPGVKDGMPVDWESDREQKSNKENEAPKTGDQSYASVASLNDEDTDAMGRSGAIIDLAASKAEEAADKVDDALQARPTSSSSSSRRDRSGSPTKLPQRPGSRAQSRSQSPSKKPFAPPGGKGK
ncbi:putative fatty acid elongation protein 4 [Cercospora beticola]|uniref:Elongation of fatty acids protein n=1 Tax=Cercospora beticola TaxID=122368 RepID=A0A2G5I307_CERBT|nr:putative fatty acid elongation protein 4 [Cercospora beticola]PIA99179.1 putative fatty acid elongation protein 4 [Cercospora beticola]WPB00137.1 hypothetical protein RHO25_004756 [Cercospora beticola]CAK1361677.1 unnamed protein product [Cercospora beticola]